MNMNIFDSKIHWSSAHADYYISRIYFIFFVNAGLSIFLQRRRLVTVQSLKHPVINF